jgi:hypothetical protein
MKVSLLCVVMLSAVSASAQCLSNGPLGKPLRVDLVMTDSTPIIIQNAYLNALLSIPDVVVRTGVSAEHYDVVVSVTGMETKDTYGNVMGDTWYYEVYRDWACTLPDSSSFSALYEYFTSSGPNSHGVTALNTAPLNRVAGVVQEDVAVINVQAFEKLRQERDASKR